MLRRPNDWENVQEFVDRPRLPLGAYIARVKQAVLQSNEYGEQLCILFDIAEGEFQGYYTSDFQNNTRPDKKWKGVLRYWLPKEDGSEKDEWTKRSLKGLVTSFERSNPGYQFDWNEKSLAGKLVGVLYRNEEWEYEGKTGWTPRPFRAISVDSVRQGDFTFPKDKPLKKKQEEGSGYSDYAVPSYPEAPSYPILDSDDSELPF